MFFFSKKLTARNVAVHLIFLDGHRNAPTRLAGFQSHHEGLTLYFNIIFTCSLPTTQGAIHASIGQTISPFIAWIASVTLNPAPVNFVFGPGNH